MKRNYSLDLLRILSMFMIIGLHFLHKGGFLENSTGIFCALTYGIEALMLCSVNVFVLITGYFLCDKQSIKLKKIISYFLQLWVIGILTFLILKVFNLYSFKKEDYIYAFIPFLSSSNWFFNCYILLYLIHIYLNKIIEKIDKKKFELLLLILFIFFSLIPTVIPQNEWIIDSTNGYGINWFVFLYYVGAYLKKYENKYNLKKIYYLFGFFAFPILLELLTFIIKKYNSYLPISFDVSKIYSYNNFLVFLSGVSLFLFFKNIVIKNKKIINIIKFNVPFVFGVYLIHEQRFLREILWTEILNVDIYFNNYWMIIAMIISIIVVYCSCTLFQYIFLKIFSKYNLVDKITNKLKKIKFISTNFE